MTDAECVVFLQWALPQMGLRWPGYRKVRGQVCKRIRRRMAALELRDVEAYKERLQADPSEWQVLVRLCVVTISRFYRDRRVWDTLRADVLPALADAATAAKDDELRCWSIGCASGEEPYTLAIAWELELARRYPGLRLEILATDVDEQVLERAATACYAGGSLRDLPAQWIDQAFERRGEEHCLRDRFRAAVELRRQDVRAAAPERLYRLIFCRNIVCTYFDEAQQRAVLGRVLARLAEGGAFVLGRHEQLPSGLPLEPWAAEHGIHRRRGAPSTTGSRRPR